MQKKYLQICRNAIYGNRQKNRNIWKYEKIYAKLQQWKYSNKQKKAKNMQKYAKLCTNKQKYKSYAKYSKYAKLCKNMKKCPKI